MLADWDASFAGFWDDAISRSSPLRAAVLRSLKAEVAVILRMTSLSINWDISAFFDNMHLGDLIPQALERDFHRKLLAMAMRMHGGYLHLFMAHQYGQSIAGWMHDERQLN